MTRLIALLFACALLAGCGGGDDGGGEDAGPSNEEFVADANAICREGEEKISEVSADAQDRIQQAGSQEERQQVVGDVLEETVEAYRPYLDRLGDVEAPADVQEDWTRFVEDIREAFELIPELADATRTGDREQLSQLTTEFTRIARETRPFAERAGLQDCLPEPGTR